MDRQLRYVVEIAKDMKGRMARRLGPGPACDCQPLAFAWRCGHHVATVSPPAFGEAHAFTAVRTLRRGFAADTLGLAIDTRRGDGAGGAIACVVVDDRGASAETFRYGFTPAGGVRWQGPRATAGRLADRLRLADAPAFREVPKIPGRLFDELRAALDLVPLRDTAEVRRSALRRGFDAGETLRRIATATAIELEGRGFSVFIPGEPPSPRRSRRPSADWLTAACPTSD